MFNSKEIAFFESTPTPFYYYNAEVLSRTLDIVRKESTQYGYHVHYAMKANVNPKIIEIIQNYGFGADCVSGNEISIALKHGFKPSEIVFAGVGKTDKEIELGLENNIFCFNCESIPEIQVIDELAIKHNTKARIALRINPNIAIDTHHYITTGLEENKFGINIWELENVLLILKKLKNIELIGLHFHIGSQITDLNDFKGLCLRVNEIQEWFFRHHIIVDHINVGGGLGVDYKNPDQNIIPDFKSFFKIFDNILELKQNQQLHFELGRSLVAHCGTLISKVLYVKEGVQTKFVILDAGMTELIRPALYQAYHKVENLSSTGKNSEKYDVVGPICESSDCFGKAIMLPYTKRGDIIAIRSTGAYGEVMASRYNARDLVKSYYK